MSTYDSRKPWIEASLPLMLSAAGEPGVLPFTMIKIKNVEWAAASLR